MTSTRSTTTVAAFNKILNQPKLQRSTRSTNDIVESIKRLRRLILVEGIPSNTVSVHGRGVKDTFSNYSSYHISAIRTPPFVLEYGRFSFVLMRYLQMNLPVM